MPPRRVKRLLRDQIEEVTSPCRHVQIEAVAYQSVAIAVVHRIAEKVGQAIFPPAQIRYAQSSRNIVPVSDRSSHMPTAGGSPRLPT